MLERPSAEAHLLFSSSYHSQIASKSALAASLSEVESLSRRKSFASVQLTGLKKLQLCSCSVSAAAVRAILSERNSCSKEYRVIEEEMGTWSSQGFEQYFESWSCCSFLVAVTSILSLLSSIHFFNQSLNSTINHARNRSYKSLRYRNRFKLLRICSRSRVRRKDEQ